MYNVYILFMEFICGDHIANKWGLTNRLSPYGKDIRNIHSSPPTKQLVLIYAASGINSWYMVVQNNKHGDSLP